MNSSDYLFSALFANQVKKSLESKNIKVESDFSARHALMGMALNNPWAFSFLMQQELDRLDTSTASNTSTTNGQTATPTTQAVDVNSILEVGIEKAVNKLDLKKAINSQVDQSVGNALANIKQDIEQILEGYVTAAIGKLNLNAEVDQSIQKAMAKLKPLEGNGPELEGYVTAAMNKLNLKEGVQEELQRNKEDMAAQLTLIKSEMAKIVADTIADLELEKHLGQDFKTDIENALKNVFEGTLTEGMRDMAQQFNAYLDDIKSLKQEIANLRDDVIALKEQTKVDHTDEVLKAELEKAQQELKTIKVESEKWRQVPISIWKRIANEVKQQDFFVTAEDGKVVLTGLTERGTPDTQSYKLGYLNLLKQYFEREGIKLPPALTPLETAWENLTADLHRKEVFVSLENGKVVLMGLNLQGTPDSQNFRAGYLAYIKKYFGDNSQESQQDANTALQRWNTDLRRKEVEITIEDGKVILSGLKLPNLPDTQDFKKGYLEYLRSFFGPLIPSQGIVAKEKTEPEPTTSRSTILPKDDLSQLVGIGKVIQRLLAEHGIYTFRQLSAMTTEDVKAVLEQAGANVGMTDPASWIAQASLLAEGRREEWLAGKKNPKNQ